jgi:hypothetical protein
MTCPMLPLAAALTDKPALLDSISYQLVGLIVVFSALGSIWGLMELMGWVFRTVARQTEERVLAQRSLSAEEPTAGDLVPSGVSPELLAVITAAAHELMQAGEHIVSIVPDREANVADVNLLAWSNEGRRQLFASHKLR